jgi:hypothetical protein
MFLDQVMNEKRIADCILISLGLESYVNHHIPGVPSLVSRRKMTLKLNYIYMKVL